MKKFTLKKPDGTEVVLDQDSLVIGYNNREINPNWSAKVVGATEWSRVDALLGVESAVSPPVSSQPPSKTENTISVVCRRYQDAYLVARATVGIGQAVKVIGVVLGILVLLGVAALGGQGQGSQSTAFVLGGVLAGIIVGIPLYVLGILVAAQGQVLKATLDAAVHTSPFLQKDDMAKIMSL